MLFRASQAATAAGVALRLAVGAHPVRRVLELTGADQVIDTYPDLDAAAHGPAATG
jgi:anti-anti-sigma regulatory factor